MSDYTYAYYFTKRWAEDQGPGDRVAFRRMVSLKGPLGPLSAVIFLLYRPSARGEVGVWPFLRETMPRLLPLLARTSHIERIEMNGEVQGRVEWPATFKARSVSDSNPALFICRQNRKRYDEPENELLKFCLAQVQACLDTIPAGLDRWMCWRLEGTDARRSADPQPVGEQLRMMAARLRAYRSNVYLREVDLPRAVTSRHLAAARTSKNELYGDVADLYDLYRQVVEADSWERWAQLLYQTAPLPPGFDATSRELLLAV